MTKHITEVTLVLHWEDHDDTFGPVDNPAEWNWNDFLAMNTANGESAEVVKIKEL